MSRRQIFTLGFVSAAIAVPLVVSCSGPDGSESTGGTVGVGGATSGGTAPTTGGTSTMGGTTTTSGGTTTTMGGATTTTGGSTTTTGGAATTTGGTAGSSGATSTGGSAGKGATGGSVGTGGSAGAATGGTGGASSTGGSAGKAATGGTGGSAGGASGGTTSKGGAGGSAGSGVAGGYVVTTVAPPAPATLDCGAKGTALENAGPPMNRLNYVIVGDGYSDAELAAGGTLDKHMMAMTAKRFSDPIGQPYLRYRKFVNICVLRIASSPICGSSTFGCCGNDSSRLANCNTSAVSSAITSNIPASFEIDWRTVVLNGSSWWNSGGAMMMYSGGNQDGPGAALHEGGHGHNQLADEYDACESGRVRSEAAYGVNVSLTNGTSNGKWDGWIGYNQTPGTGMQGFYACTGGATWRSSQNSMMNSLFGNNPNTSFNSVSREKIVMDIWRAVQSPYDSVTPAAGAVTNPATLTVNVIDTAVISVDWSVDGTVVARNAGNSLNVAGSMLPAGSHMITARAYDNADTNLVRQVPGTTFYRQYWGSGAMGHSDKTVTWTVTIQ